MSSNRLFLHWAKVYSPFIMMQLITSTMMLATSMYQFDLVSIHSIQSNVTTLKSSHNAFQLLQNHEYVQLAVVLFALSFGMIVLFFYCYFGKMATDSFGNIADCIYYEMKWQKLPLALQKCISLMLRNMQKPIHYHGFDVITLDLRTFTHVSSECHFEKKNGAYSWKSATENRWNSWNFSKFTLKMSKKSRTFFKLDRFQSKFTKKVLRMRDHWCWLVKLP